LQNEPLEVTLKVTDVLEELAVEYLISPELSAKFASPEDTVLAKLEWYRLGGEVSERQWRDVLGVLRARGSQLDLEYMRKWAGELHVGDLLERGLQEAG
jgi:hypothetical protein